MIDVLIFSLSSWSNNSPWRSECHTVCVVWVVITVTWQQPAGICWNSIYRALSSEAACPRDLLLSTYEAAWGWIKRLKMFTFNPGRALKSAIPKSNQDENLSRSNPFFKKAIKMIWIFLEYRPSTSQALTSSYWMEKKMQLILNCLSLRKRKSSYKYSSNPKFRQDSSDFHNKPDLFLCGVETLNFSFI